MDRIQTVCIFGVQIAAVNMKRLLAYTCDHLEDLSGDYICVSNVHTTVMSYDDPEYCAVQNGAALAIPDGAPLSLIGRARGQRTMRRTTGPGYMEEIFRISAEKGYTHYFYGSTKETLRKMRHNLLRAYPGIRIAGFCSPPFRPLTEEEDRRITERINELKPDFVWVGLGAPKQERWMADHKGRVHGLMVGVGAGFDYFAGNIRRAPKWMQVCSMEWFYRLLQDPRHLFRRYLVTNTRFLWYLMTGKG